MSPSNNSQTPWNLLQSTIIRKQLENTPRTLESSVPLPTPSPSLLASPITTQLAEDDVTICTSNSTKIVKEDVKMTTEERLCAYYVHKYESSQKCPLPQIQPYAALIDSKATHHYLESEVLPHCTNLRAAQGPKATVANGVTISPISQASIPITTSFSQSAQHTYIFDDLKTGSLISVGQLCNDDYVVIFSRYDVGVFKNDEIIIVGKRVDNGVWDIPISPVPVLPPSTKIKISTYSITNLDHLQQSRLWIQTKTSCE